MTQIVLPAKSDRNNIRNQGNMRRAARKKRTEMPEFADEHTNFGRPREGPKARQIVTGVEQRRTWTVKTRPSSAKASPARNRALSRKETLISSATRARGAEWLAWLFREPITGAAGWTRRFRLAERLSSPTSKRAGEALGRFAGRVHTFEIACA